MTCYDADAEAVLSRLGGSGSLTRVTRPLDGATETNWTQAVVDDA